MVKFLFWLIISESSAQIFGVDGVRGKDELFTSQQTGSRENRKRMGQSPTLLRCLGCAQFTELNRTFARLVECLPNTRRALSSSAAMQNQA